jgi:flagellar biosynthesis/type III secretory pathway protein FliH
VQLNQLAWRDFLDRTNPVAAALMANMAMVPTEKPRVKLACLTMLARLQLDPARKQLISGFIDQYLQLTIEQKQEFDVELEQLIPQEKEGVMEIVTSWMEEGMEKGLALGLEQGLEKGLEKGREEGARRLVLHQLQRKFGDLDPVTLKRIETLPTDRIEELADALLNFTAHSDLVTWLQSQRT